MKTLSQMCESIESPKTPNEFVILKPGFLDYQDEFINLLKNNGWKVVTKQEKTLTRKDAENLYKDKIHEPFFNTLCDYMSSDKCLCAGVYKKCSEPIKEMCDLKKKVREQWGEDNMKNAMHCSDTAENVIRECALCGVSEDFGLGLEEPSSVLEPGQDPSVASELTKPTNPVIDRLKVAFCEEMNAWYQYCICAPFLQGGNRDDIKKYYQETAKDECDDHAQKILERLHQLDADVSDLFTPGAWDVIADHKFIRPVLNTRQSLQLNIEAELGAIETYRQLCIICDSVSDIVTKDLVKNILIDEEEHLRALKDLVSDTE